MDPATQQPLPICVDLDGTLVRTDMLLEGLCAIATSPKRWPGLITGRGSRAALKQAVARLAPIDPATLPYNTELLDFLRAEKASGRTIVLATAADQAVAKPIAAYLGVFDDVIASDGRRNLKGAAKAAALVERFGAGQFCYAGNDASDEQVWDQAGAAIVVNAPPAVLARVRAAHVVQRVIDDQPDLWPGLARAIRPHQWVKNVLVFVPIVTAHALTETSAWAGGLLAFAAFCCTASAIYIVNDLSDLSADRAHPRKRSRPFANGAVPLQAGVAAAAALLLAGLGLAFACHATAVVAIYAALSIGYSFGLKALPLVDIFILAALYTIRMVGGGEATGHRLSLWLLAFSSFLFLGLALLKRVEEMMAVALTGQSKAARRGYAVADLPVLQTFGIASAFAATIVLALFVQAEAATQTYQGATLLWLIVPLILFWQCRMWLSCARGYMHHDPVIYAARDWVSWLIGVAMGIVLLGARSISI